MGFWVYELKHQYKWDKESSVLFSKSLRSSDIQRRIEQIFENCRMQNNVDMASDVIIKVLHDVSDRSLRKKKQGKGCKKVKRNKWYDLTCVSLKRECKSLGKILQDRPFERATRERLFAMKKQYKTMVRHIKRQYKPPPPTVV